ncbi:MAG: SET domain-containing protein [Hyphomicrobiales bacterium]
MMQVRSYLMASPIEGIGVFAGESIAKGTLVWALNPRFDIFVRESEMDSLPPHMREYLARYSYPHLEEPGVVILDCDNGKHMNHSEMPNTDFTAFSRGIAIRDIAEGEELTCNYREFDPAFSGFMNDVPLSNSVRVGLSPAQK